MRVLLVGALRAETLPLLGLLEHPRPAGRRLVLGRSGPLSLGLLTCGVGPVRARDRAEAALARWPADAVISLGTCGALADGLAIGAVLSADRVGRPDGEDVPVTPLLGVSRAAVVTVIAPVMDPERRGALAAAGWALCEMEAAAVGRVAGDAGARFHALKVVSDLAGGDRARASGPLRRRDRLQFQARAAALVAARLAPALADALSRYPGRC